MDASAMLTELDKDDEKTLQNNQLTKREKQTYIVCKCLQDVYQNACDLISDH